MIRNSVYIIFIFLFVTTHLAVAQNEKEDFSDAEYSFESEEYEKALTAYKKLLTRDPENYNLNFKVGICLIKLDVNKKLALPYLEKATGSISIKYKEGNFSEKNAPIDALLNYGDILLVSYRLKEAKDAYQRYKGYLDVKDVANIDYVDQKIRSCENAEDIMRTNVYYKQIPAPEPVAKNKPRTNVVINSDGTSMAYIAENNGRKGIYFTIMKGDKWSAPIEITRNMDIDPKYDRFKLCSMSGDGIRLYVWISNDLETSIYISEFKAGKWKSGEALNNKINSMSEQTHACESPDGTQLYITSNRKGTYGGLDIFVATLNEKKQWDKPVNISNTINSPYNEETPYLSSDNQRLYFSSEGHNSMGGYDVFVSNRISGNEWSQPQNLGYPLNSTDNDLYFVPAVDENVAFYKPNSDSTPYVALIDITPLPISAIEPLPIDTQVAVAPIPPQDTIIPIIQPLDTTPVAILPVIETPAPEPVILPEEKIMFLRGSVTFSDDSRDMEVVDIKILDNSKNIINTIKPSQDGNYILQLKPGSYYAEFSATGYNKIIKPFYIPENGQVSEIFVNINLQPESIKTGEYVTIRSILFNYNSILIDREGKIMLERLIRIMKDYPALMMEIIGHADSKGNPEYNRKISLDRARIVSDYFILRGIEPTRFVLHGFGDAISIAKNANEDGSDNPEGRRFNRRAEIRLLNCSGLNIVNEEISIPENLRVTDSYEYSICIVESDKNLDKSFWAEKIDTSQVNVSTIDDKYIYTYSAPSSKGDVLLKLKDISTNFPEAFIAPQNYFTTLSKTSPYSLSTAYPAPSNFCIQLAALRNYVDVRNFKNLSNVTHHKGNDSLNRYSWGSFSTYAQAYSYLPQIHRKGYFDAFVVPESKFSGNIIDKPRTGYTVQIYSSTTEVDTSMFNSLPGFKLFKGADKFYRYTTGTFETHFEAAQNLRKIKKKGFPNACIRRLSDIVQ